MKKILNRKYYKTGKRIMLEGIASVILVIICFCIIFSDKDMIDMINDMYNNKDVIQVGLIMFAISMVIGIPLELLILKENKNVVDDNK